MKNAAIVTSLAPWLTVTDAAKAIRFYKKAFNAVESYRLDVPDGTVIARLSIDGAEFWVADGQAREPLGGGSLRMVLTVSEPKAVFKQAISAGAREIFPVAESHGWLVGRLEDPYGLHWEIGIPAT